MIPKKIFQTHEYQYKDLPQHFQQTSMSWQTMNPGWEYVYHDKDQRESFVLNNCPEIYPLYKEVKEMYQADIWRYLIVKDNGGVYADMDSFCITPMDYILKDLPFGIDMVVTNEEVNNHTNNANFAAIYGSKIMQDAVISLLSWYGDAINKYPNNSIKIKAKSAIHDAFSSSVYKNSHIVSRTMEASHSSTYQKSFDLSKIIVNDYGKKMSYTDFLSKKQ